MIFFLAKFEIIFVWSGLNGVSSHFSLAVQCATHLPAHSQDKSHYLEVERQVAAVTGDVTGWAGLTECGSGVVGPAWRGGRWVGRPAWHCSPGHCSTLCPVGRSQPASQPRLLVSRATPNSLTPAQTSPAKAFIPRELSF